MSSLPWPHADLERQHLLHMLHRLGFAEIFCVDGEYRYRLTPYQKKASDGTAPPSDDKRVQRR